VNSLDPSAPPGPPSADPARQRRRRRVAAVRRALREYGRRPSGVPATRDALGLATATEARSIAEPWSIVVDRAARVLAHDLTRNG
jgi:hypothetical protein